MRKPSAGDPAAKLRHFFDALTSAAEGIAHAAANDAPLSPTAKQDRAVFGYTVQVGLDGLKAQRFGDMPPARRAAAKTTATTATKTTNPRPAPEPAAMAPRAPIVDLFEEDGGICIVAELPGADGADVQCTLLDNCLVIETTGQHMYRKSIPLTVAVDPASLASACRNGILEVRLRLAASP